MSLVCPDCGRTRLAIAKKIELASDYRSDEVQLQVVECAACGLRSMAVYEESRRGGMDDESWDHTGYRVGAKTLEELSKLIRACPNPNDSRCGCAVHMRLHRKDAQSGWASLVKDVDWREMFKIGMA